MEGYPYPLLVEGDWTSVNAKTLQSKVHIYFQSKKKSQGGDCFVCWSERSCTVFFRSEEIRDQVLAKADHEISIEKQVVKLKVSKPDSGSRTGDTSQESVKTGSDASAGAQQPACSVRVDNVPADTITNKQLLELYFEKWGGPVKKLSTNPDERSVIITFSSEDAAKKILEKKDHVLSNQPVTIRPYFGLDASQTEASGGLEDSSWSNAVVLENVPEDINQEYLMLLVGSLSSISEDEYSLEFIQELNTAVMTYNDPNAVDKFLTECQTKRKFKECGLKARPLEKSRSVKVENLPADCNDEFLVLYFEKHVGAVEKIKALADEHAAIVTFRDQQAVQKVLGEKLSIRNTPIDVYPYCISLGSALYGKDRPAWTLPKPFTHQIHPAIIEFIQKTGQTSSISNQMSPHFCQVNMDKDEVLFSPLPALLKQKGITKKHIDSWKQDTIDAFKTILSSFDVFEHAVIPSVWTVVEKDIRSVVKDKAVLEVDVSTGCLTLAGMAKDINLLKPILEKFLKEASSQMERDMNKTSQNITMSPAKFYLFQEEGLQQRASAKYPQLELMFKKDTNKLTLTGLPTEIFDIKNMILETQLSMKEKTLKMDPSLLEFLRSVDSEEMSRDLFTSKGISAVYRYENGSIVLTASTDKALNDAEKSLEMMLTLQSLSVEDQDILKKPEWQDLINQLYEAYNLSRKKTMIIKSSEDMGTVVVCGFQEPVTEVSKCLEQFINSHRTEHERGSDEAAAFLPPDGTKAVVLEKLPENFTRDVLMIIVDSICSLSDNEYFLELVPESNTAVVTFNDLSVAEMFLNKCRTTKKFQEYGLMARPLETSRSIKVENLPAQCPEDLLELYFDKWGGEVERIDAIADEQAAIVTFHDQDAVKKILKKEHLIRNAQVEIYPYYTSLGSALYGKDRATWTLPKPFVYEIHPAIREFIQKTGQISSICNQMSSNFCQVNMDKDEVLFSPLPALLRQKGITKKHIDNWKQDTIDAFKTILSSFGVFEHAVIPSVWTVVEQDIRSVVKDKAVLMIDVSTGCLTLAGMAKDINMLKPILEKCLEQASIQRERGGKGQSALDKVIHFKSCALVKFIQEKKSKVWREFLKSVQVKIHFDSKRSLIRVSGEDIHVEQALDFFQKIAESLCTDRLTIRKAGAKKYFQEQGSVVLMTINESRFVVVLEEDYLEKEVNVANDVRLEDFGQLLYDVHTPDATRRRNSDPLFRPRFEKLDISESGFLETKSTKEGLKIILRKGNIQDAHSDVIVNTISEDLDLSKGAVSKALLNAAGPQIQAETYSHRKALRTSSLNHGDLVVTSGYNLNCQRAYHTICPVWNGGHRSEHETLKGIIQNCLKRAENQKMASISFPAIGTGNLGFPRDLVSKILLSEIHAFSARVSPQYLNEVTVIVHPSDNETVQCFVKSFRGEWQGAIMKGAHAVQQSPAKKPPPVRAPQSAGFIGAVSTLRLGVHKMQIGHVTLEVSSGDITKERCDAIINSSNQSFTLKSGVSLAILNAAGLAVERECAQIVAASQSQQEMIMTSGGQLPCSNIIHIIGRNSPADIKNVVYNVLRLCDGQKFSSVAFPALGTGQGGAQPSAVADAMIEAVIDFVRKKKGTRLQSVKFLIFQTSMVSDFHQSMLKRQQESVEEGGVMGWFKGTFDATTNFFTGGGYTEGSANEEFVFVGEEFEPVVFQLCGESEEALSEARNLITSFIVKEHISSKIQDSAISYFSQEEADMLSKLQRELTVSIHLSKRGPEPELTMEGLTRDVVKAESQIRDMIRKAEKNMTRQREAFILSSQVEWQHQDRSRNFVPFDILTNYDLEQAFMLKQSRVKININNDPYEANVALGVATGKYGQIELKRTDLKQKASFSLPSDWEDMKGKLVLLVEIKQGTQEYTDVEQQFRKTGLTANILKIERVQNETLWKNYMNQKAYLEHKNKHKNNEKLLFHGTGSDNIDKINERGFNRSYAGTHGGMIGNGVYFAVDAQYSARGYAKPDLKGHKRMYLARVLVGDFTTGRSGLLAPPAKNSTGTEQYDSVTNGQQSMFMIFHDVQAYPEYLITFQ